MIELVESGVVFNEENHTYFLGDKQLSGITGMIKRQLFPDKYKEVPQYILERAADRGTRVHHECQFVDTTGFEPESQEAMNYLLLRTGAGYKALANEYTVSDGENFASNIDCVWEKNEKIALVDVKTTYAPDEEYLAWQLSIYAYLFELQNPHLKVDSLFGAWLYNEKSKLIPLVRKSDVEVKRLLQCEVEGTSYLETETVIEHKKDEVQLLPKDVINKYLEAVEEVERIQPFIDGFKDSLKRAMVEHDVKSWDTGILKATITPAGIKKSFDTKRFQSEHPELYKQYIKETETAASIRITLRKEDTNA
ncbi:PD-(D/E)XK nuclease family protein [Bacteroides mediterraneensis]|nr:PD-(D/E)XK nuclease family protein [Bacteroides mediterraneensis]